MGIGIRIKQLRKQSGLTQPELAEQVGVHETTIRRWEKETDNGPDNKAVKKLAEILKTTSDYLLSGTGKENQVTAPTDKTNDGHLVFRDRDRVVDLPDTPDNRILYVQIVNAMLGKPPAVTA